MERKEERGGGRVRRVGEKDTQKSAKGSLESLAEYWSEHFVMKLHRETTTQNQKKSFLELTQGKEQFMFPLARMANLIHHKVSDGVLRRVPL